MNKRDLTKINWIKIQKIHDDGIYWSCLTDKTGLNIKLLERAVREGFIVKKLHIIKHSEIEKEKISNARKKYLRENPDKHPWKRNSKFKSNPCELVKKKLNDNNIIFIDEYQPSDEKFYSLDIAFPNKKIAIEINGNQHYNNDGTLKEYYQIRHNFFENIGWKIIEIHYSMVYDKILINQLIENIEDNSMNQEEYDKYLSERITRKKKNEIKNICVDCGIPINKQADRCVKCHSLARRKVDRPTKDELQELINNNNNWSKLGRKFSVSDTAIRKWAKQYNLI